jgi:hypothetical protein
LKEYEQGNPQKNLGLQSFTIKNGYNIALGIASLTLRREEQKKRLKSTSKTNKLLPMINTVTAKI